MVVSDIFEGHQFLPKNANQTFSIRASCSEIIWNQINGCYFHRNGFITPFQVNNNKRIIEIL